jgi:murein tripeptide amidase MpaA
MTRSAALFACIVSLSLAAGVSIADETRPHIRAEVTYETKDQLQALLATDVDITHAHGSEFDVLATPEQLSRLRSLGLTVRVVDENVYGSDGLRGGGWLSAYMSYPEAAAALSALASAYPALTELTSIGQSHEGNDIWALKVSDNASTDENEPEVLINGNHHAREVITPIICVAMAESLLTNYGTDPQYTEWVDEREIWFVPVVNPDGLLWVESNDLFWRKNRWVDPGSGTTYGVDLNRNYPYEWGHDNNGSDASKSGTTYRGPSAGSEPETQVMMAFIDSREFKYVLSFHAYGNLTLWGPGYKPALPVDQDVLRAWATSTSRTASRGTGSTIRAATRRRITSRRKSGPSPTTSTRRRRAFPR